ncbi:MAG: radical SAM protein [Ignavibacteriales bacterium]|nr:radical SAM protein [Ignavibacteriales bacterium]
MLKVNEIYASIQGESTFAGLPCTFVRLTYCNLRCSYCDTEYAFYEGAEMPVEEIIKKVQQYGNNLVEITGGEPLVQPMSLNLMTELANRGYKVLLETGGSLPVEKVDPRVHIIMDIKTPYSKMEKKNRYENINFLKLTDEVKFVLGSQEDITWAIEKIHEFNLTNKCKVLFSPVFGTIKPVEIVDRIVQERLPVRFQLQLHKFIWPVEQKGV